MSSNENQNISTHDIHLFIISFFLSNQSIICNLNIISPMCNITDHYDPHLLRKLLIIIEIAYLDLSWWLPVVLAVPWHLSWHQWPQR